jgi:hypothetical protein
VKSGKIKQNGKEEIRKAQKSKKSLKSKQKLKINTPPEINPLNASSPPQIVIYHVSSLIHPVSKEFNQLCVHTLPL